MAPGARYSRTRAPALLGTDDLSRAMAGIKYRHSKVPLGESPAAYKDIDEVTRSGLCERL